MMKTTDQKKHWNQLHKQKVMEEYSKEASEFAVEINDFLPKKAKILELGCGLGNDSYYFSTQGHNVLSTDFSDEAISSNKEKYRKVNNLEFKVMDTSKPMVFDNASFDVVYARLSLHYFSDEVTKKIFSEITRVLKNNGLLIFVCKSIEDSLYGQGECVEKDMFLRNGHVRHFFSEDYVKECLDDKYEIVKMWSGRENFYGKNSAFVKVVAKKSSQEMVDIVDENNIVQYQTRKVEAHKEGLLHRTVIAEVIDSEGRFTLVKQSSDRQDAGQYVSPVGGHVKAGESEEEALSREALEEMGLSDFSHKYIGKVIYNRKILGRQENHYFILYEIYSDENPTLNHESVGFEKFSKKDLRTELKTDPKKFGDAFHFVVKTFYPQLLK